MAHQEVDALCNSFHDFFLYVNIIHEQQGWVRLSA
jgi:hypothetical protein